MGLAQPALRLIAREHLRRPFTGPVLTLGRQHVYATPDEVVALLKEEGITPAAEGVSAEQLATRIPSLAGTGYVSEAGFFRLLGIRETVEALDYSAFENADIVHDLNNAVPEHLHGRFDLVLDGGTMEHVFDVRRSLSNIGLLLRHDGRVIHISPANNFVNHGFYQFSPTFFFDYYGTNQFADLNGLVFEYDPYLPERRHVWHVFEASPDTGWMTSRDALMMMFTARKTASSTTDKIPLQSYYRNVYGRALPASGARARSYLKGLVPAAVKPFLSKHLPWVGRSRKPWGLKSLGHIR